MENTVIQNMDPVNVTIYLGLNDKDTKVQMIETETAFTIVSELITKKFGAGSIFYGSGVYSHENGEIVHENTLQIQLFSVSEAAAREFCDVLKTRFNQESVGLRIDRITTIFV